MLQSGVGRSTPISVTCGRFPIFLCDIKSSESTWIAAAVLQQRCFLPHDMSLVVLGIIRKSVSWGPGCGKHAVLEKDKDYATGLMLESLQDVSVVAALYIVPVADTISPRLFSPSFYYRHAAP